MLGEDKDARPEVDEATSVDVVADALGTVAVSDGVGDGSTQSSDTSADGASASSEEGERVDPELWKPHPPTKECPVCFVRLPLAEGDSTYMYFVCCGKTICNGCTIETIRAANVINAKRAKKKLPLIAVNSCAFCRTVPTAYESQFEERIRKGDGQAAYNLALRCRGGDVLTKIPKDEAKSLELLHHAADDLRFPVAMALLGRMYFRGRNGATKDEVKGRKYLEDAVKMGDIIARNLLACIEAEEENIELAIRHWKLAAAVGHDRSVKALWECFYRGSLKKSRT